jgi:hypothetical protein
MTPLKHTRIFYSTSVVSKSRLWLMKILFFDAQVHDMGAGAVEKWRVKIGETMKGRNLK